MVYGACMLRKFATLALLISFALPAPAFASFEDVESGSSYQEAVDYLELQGAVDPGEEFRPNDFVRRAEFFKMLFKVFEESSKSSGVSSFEDVPVDSWFAPYAELAHSYQLVEDDLFEPGKTVRRVEALEWLMQAYGLSAPVIPMNERSDLFRDVEADSEHYSLIAQASAIGVVIPNVNEKYLPNVRLTRAELAEMMYSFEQWYTTDLSTTTNEFYKSDIFADIWNRILTDFYIPSGTTISQEALFQIAVRAVLESLEDPYTKYFDSESADDFMQVLTGDLEGIGAILLQDEATMEIFITEFLVDSPASKSGLQVGDQIIAVDGVSIEGMLMENVINRIKGPAGTDVEITVLRDGKEHTYAITRAVLVVEIVHESIYKKDNWLIEIDSFGDNIFEEIMMGLETLEAEVPEPKAIILDLRGNPGGYVGSANFVAGLFVPQLTPLVTLDYGGHEETIYNGDVGPYQGIPLYVLVDEFTASAAEILTLTLSEEADATVIGTQTFGKGTAQEVITYWDGSLLKMTIAEWKSSQGNSVQGVGVTPDILITGESETKDLWLQEVSELLD